jgi:hypothetical protein
MSAVWCAIARNFNVWSAAWWCVLILVSHCITWHCIYDTNLCYTRKSESHNCITAIIVLMYFEYEYWAKNVWILQMHYEITRDVSEVSVHGFIWFWRSTEKQIMNGCWEKINVSKVYNFLTCPRIFSRVPPHMSGWFNYEGPVTILEPSRRNSDSLFLWIYHAYYSLLLQHPSIWNTGPMDTLFKRPAYGHADHWWLQMYKISHLE